MDDLKHFRSFFNCKKCSKENERLQLCLGCYLEALRIKVPLPTEKKQKNKWQLYKRISYIALFVSVPLFAIGWYFGFEMQMIVIAAYLYGVFIINIIDWFMENF